MSLPRLVFRCWAVERSVEAGSPVLCGALRGDKGLSCLGLQAAEGSWGLQGCDQIPVTLRSPSMVSLSTEDRGCPPFPRSLPVILQKGAQPYPRDWALMTNRDATNKARSDNSLRGQVALRWESLLTAVYFGHCFRGNFQIKLCEEKKIQSSRQVPDLLDGMETGSPRLRGSALIFGPKCVFSARHVWDVTVDLAVSFAWKCPRMATAMVLRVAGDAWVNISW